MSSPISIGDIMLLAGFTAKVIAALKTSGSATQYQTAERHCRNFMSIMETIKSLDLTQVPEAFRLKLEEYSTDLTSFVDEFKNTIKKYDKALGRKVRRRFSWRAWFGGAPRKIQWAFAAAEDLERFRLVLSGHLDLVKVAIQGSLLAMLSGRSEGGSGVLTTTTATYDLSKLGAVEQLTGQIYSRLISRSTGSTPSRDDGAVAGRDHSGRSGTDRISPAKSGTLNEPSSNDIEQLLQNLTPVEDSYTNSTSPRSLAISALQTSSQITMLIDCRSHDRQTKSREWKQLRAEIRQCSQLLRIMAAIVEAPTLAGAVQVMAPDEMQESLKALRAVKAALEEDRRGEGMLHVRFRSHVDVYRLLGEIGDVKVTLSHIRDYSAVQERQILHEQIAALKPAILSPEERTRQTPDRPSSPTLCARCAAVVDQESDAEEEEEEEEEVNRESTSIEHHPTTAELP